MGRAKGAKNKNSAVPTFFGLSPEERIELITNLIIDKILEDQKKGQPLLKKIEGESRVQQPASK